MSEQLQLRRGNATQLATFTGAQGECVVDTTNNRLVVNDGSTAGGWPAAKLSEVETIGRSTVNNLNYVVQVTDRLVGYATLATPAIVSLAASSLYPVGCRLTVVDESGNATAAITITIQPNGSDNINGVNAPIVIGAPYGSITLENAGGGNWFIIANNKNPNTYTPITDTSYTAALTDRNIIFTTLTSARQVTLPLSVKYPLGQVLSVSDSTGNCSASLSITVVPNGSNLINGSGSYFVLNSPYQYADFLNTPTGWVVAAPAAQVAQQSFAATLSFRSRGITVAATGDTPIPIQLPAGVTAYQIDSVLVDNASTAPTSTARIGLYTAATQGGVNFAAQQAINGITSALANTNGNSLRLTLTNNTTTTVTATTLYVNVGTANGSALTVDVTITLKVG
jgi:hypothetical protein